MKKINLSHYVLIYLSFILISCASSLPPNSLISSKYFDLTSPNENGWNSSSEIQSNPRDSIYLQKGHGPGNLSSADFPIKTLIIMRKSILDSALEVEELKSKLYQYGMAEIKEIVGKLGQRFYINQFLSNPLYFNDKLLCQFTYNVSFFFDSSGIPTSTPASMKHNVNLGSGVGQFYIYLPKFYKEWNSYYLFLYDQYPEIDSIDEGLSSAKSVGQKSDSIKPKTIASNEMIYELSEFIDGFTCIEDSLKK
jgi:hypothetical protein